MSAQPRSQTPLFYKRVAALSRERHGNWYIDPEPGYRFARETNCVYVAGVEFPLASREYPIVFTAGAEGTVLPVVLLGLRDEQNLFLNDNAEWQATYIPAYVRRYPFILAADGTGQNFTVCIDESYSGFNTVREGERLLAEDGSQGPILARSVEFLKDYQRQSQLTSDFCRALVEANVLEPVQANIQTRGGEKFAMAGFSCVGRERLKALPGDTLKDWIARGYLDLVYAHLFSLSNMTTLVNRLG